VSEYYARDGRPLTRAEAMRPEHHDMDRRRVALDELEAVTVSTVHLLHNHQFGDGPPLIFETMVFPRDEWSDLHCERYSTEAEAVAGHAEILARAKAGEWS